MSIQQGVNQLINTAVGVNVAKEKLLEKEVSESKKLEEKSKKELEATRDYYSRPDVRKNMDEARERISLDIVKMDYAKRMEESKRKVKKFQELEARKRMYAFNKMRIKFGGAHYGEV